MFIFQVEESFVTSDSLQILGLACSFHSFSSVSDLRRRRTNSERHLDCSATTTFYRELVRIFMLHI